MRSQFRLIMQAATQTVTAQTRRTIAFTKLSIVSIGLITSSLVPMVAFSGTAHADTDCSPNGVAKSGSSWSLSGGGVNICNHPGDGSSVHVNNRNGQSTLTGTKWECVEMVNRLYLTKGWTTANWYGNGGGSPDGLIYHVPSGSGLTAQFNGSISYIDPGDVITLNYGTFGHAGIIDSISGGTFNILNQNADLTSSAYVSAGSLSGGNATLHMNAWAGYTVQGVIHAPITNPSSSPSTPTAVSRGSNDMDVFYNDGNNNIANYKWNSTTGWSTHSIADTTNNVSGQPAVVSRTNDSTDTFYYTPNHKLMVIGWTASGGWTGPTALLTSGVYGDPAVVARDANNMQVFFNDSSGNIKSIYWTASGGWNTNLQQLYGPDSGGGDPYAITRTTDSMDVFFVKNNENLVHLGWTAASGWNTSDWTTYMVGKPTAITWNSGNDMAAFYKQINNNVGEENWDSTTGWAAQTWVASLSGNPSAVAGVSHTIDNFYRETGGNIVDRYLSGSTWATTNVVGSNSSTSSPFAITRGTTSEEVFYWNGTSFMDANWNTTSQAWSAAQIN
jgi:hypothetical protein